MSDFRASIEARLDLNKIPGDIKEIEKKKILLSNFQLVTKDLPSKIQASLDGHKFKINLDGIKMGNIDSQMRKVGDSASRSFSQSFTAYKDLMSLQRRLSSANLQFAKLDSSKDVAQIKELGSQIQRLEQEYKQLFSTASQDLSPTQFKNLDAAINAVADKLSVLEAKLHDTSAVKKTEASFTELYNTAKKISSLKLTIAGLDGDADSNQIAALKAQLEGLEATYDTLSKSLAGKLSTDQLEKLKTVSVETADKLSVLEAKLRDAAKPVSALDVAKFDNQLTSWLQKNSRAAGDFGNSIEVIRNKLHALHSTGELTEDVFEGLKNELESINQLAIKTGKTGQSFTSTFKNAFRSILNYVSVSSVIYQAARALKEMYQNVVEIDTAMTELRKVTDESAASYSKFLKNAGSTAKEIGSTVTDIINSTADFSRLGYTFEESQELAKVANIYAVVGDDIDNIDTATSSLISTMTAFKIEATDAITIIDKYNEIGNRFAISSGGIGDALERSASSLAAANNTLDESIALITAANTVVQDADAVGTAFKTISMRIRGATTELEEAGLDTEGMAESVSTLREEILALSGVDIMLDDETFKSTYQIMDELSEKWSQLTDIQQASITELIAGKRQGNIVSSLMENFDIAREALQASIDSEGSAMAEHEKYMESIAAKINQLQAAWQELSQTFLSSSLVTSIVDVGTVTLSTLTAIIDTIGSLNTVLLGVSLYAFIANFD